MYVSYTWGLWPEGQKPAADMWVVWVIDCSSSNIVEVSLSKTLADDSSAPVNECMECWCVGEYSLQWKISEM